VTDDGADDVAQAVAARLQQLAGHARPADDTTARAVAASRDRQRVVRWAAGALVVVLLLGGASLARTAVAEPASQQVLSAPRRDPVPPPVYDLPVRGSLDGDADFLAAMAERTWSIPLGYTGGTLDPEPGTSRVVFAGDVPGGHRWAVVLARSGVQWMLAWFAGPRGADPGQMVPAVEPMPFLGSQPIALMDVSEVTGPLVVLGEPGQAVEYSASLDRAPDGQLVRDFRPLPVVDGVPMGEVTMPITWGAEELRVVEDGSRRIVSAVLSTGAPHWGQPMTYGPGPVDDTVLSACLTAAGFDVRVTAGGQGVSWADPSSGRRSSAEQAVVDRQIDECYAQATAG
jgi:hypothetical protein